MRNDTRWWGLWLFLLLAAVGGAQIAGFDFNNVESGAAAPAPDLEVDRVLDEDFYREIDRYLDNNLAVRGLGLRARALVDWELLGDSTSVEVVAGADDWLFLTDYLDPDCDALAGATAFADFDAGAGELAFLFARPKAVFHGDVLPAFAVDDACARPARDSVDEALGSRSVTVDPGLNAIVERGGDAFLRDDTHWSTAARLVVAEAIVEHFGPGLWDDGAVVESPVPRLGGLRRFLGYAVADDMAGHAVDRPVLIEQEVISEVIAEPVLLRQISRSDVPDVVPGVTYILGDSQMAHVLPLINSYFEELYFVNWLAVALGGSAMTDAPDPDRLLIQRLDLGAVDLVDDPVLLAVVDRLS